MVSAKFTELYNKIVTLTSGPSQDDQLDLYAWAKIAQEVDMGQRPGMLNFVGTTKWDRWKRYVSEGVSPADAEERYIALAGKLIAAHK